jgi:hypothetical protein
MLFVAGSFEIHHDADLPLPRMSAERLHAAAVRTKQIVTRNRCLVQIAVTRRKSAVQVAAVGDDPRLVQRRPHRHTIAESGKDRRGVIAKPIGAVAIEPPATVVKRRRQVPVEECRVWCDVRRQQRVDEMIIEIEATLVDTSGATRQHAAPTDAEAIRLQTESLHERHVVAPAIIVIARDIPGVAIRRPTGTVRESLPYAGACTVGERTAFDLIGRRRGAPEKRIGETVRGARGGRGARGAHSNWNRIASAGWRGAKRNTVRVT